MRTGVDAVLVHGHAVRDRGRRRGEPVAASILGVQGQDPVVLEVVAVLHPDVHHLVLDHRRAKVDRPASIRCPDRGQRRLQRAGGDSIARRPAAELRPLPVLTHPRRAQAQHDEGGLSRGDLPPIVGRGHVQVIAAPRNPGCRQGRPPTPLALLGERPLGNQLAGALQAVVHGEDVGRGFVGIDDQQDVLVGDQHGVARGHDLQLLAIGNPAHAAGGPVGGHADHLEAGRRAVDPPEEEVAGVIGGHALQGDGMLRVPVPAEHRLC